MSEINRTNIDTSGGKPVILTPRTSERGYRATDESRLRAMYMRMYADPSFVAMVRDIRIMDRRDPRVKNIHKKSAEAMTKTGLLLENTSDLKWLRKEWKEFEKRLGLANRNKLISDAKGALMEGNLALQWVLDDTGQNVVRAIRMPTETLRPDVNDNGQFRDPSNAWEQWDQLTGRAVAKFALWQMTVGRIDPDNFDDMGSMGRPLLDATREGWKKLVMTEEDLVIRRRERAPMRTAHTLEGASPAELETYRAQVEGDQQSITTNYYLNKAGGVAAVQGDANLDQILDVVHLLDTFFSGAPGPKALFGYPGDTNRDVLEDLKKDWFDVLDTLQDVISWVYEQGFRLQLLLKGRNPDFYDFKVKFSERLTTTPNQKMDMALKAGALGASKVTVFETAGLDAELERTRLDKQQETDPFNPYPSKNEILPKKRVKITEDNASKGESATDIATA
jgi:hypothetical protein